MGRTLLLTADIKNKKGCALPCSCSWFVLYIFHYELFLHQGRPFPAVNNINFAHCNPNSEHLAAFSLIQIRVISFDTYIF